MVESRREQAKEERRDRIRAAADQLIRERGDTEFSMRELADTAGVAFATPFNLFESKEGLLASLFADRILPRQVALASAPLDPDPVAHVIAFTGEAFGTYTEDDELFGPLLQAVIAPGSPSEGRPLEAATEFWTRCLEPARDAGLLRPDADDPRLDRALHLAFRGALLCWARGEVTAEEGRDDVQFAVRSILAGSLVDEARARATAASV